MTDEPSDLHRRLKLLRVNTEILSSFFRGPPRLFRIDKGLPEDAELIDVFNDPMLMTGDLLMKFQSASWPVVKPGYTISFVDWKDQPQYSSVTDQPSVVGG